MFFVPEDPPFPLSLSQGSPWTSHSSSCTSSLAPGPHNLPGVWVFLVRNERSASPVPNSDFLNTSTAWHNMPQAIIPSFLERLRNCDSIYEGNTKRCSAPGYPHPTAHASTGLSYRPDLWKEGVAICLSQRAASNTGFPLKTFLFLRASPATGTIKSVWKERAQSLQ